MLDSRELGYDLSIPILRNTTSFRASRVQRLCQSYLGLTIKLYDGEVTRVRYTNMLDEPTSAHAHGHMYQVMSTVPQSAIPPVKRGRQFPIKQQARPTGITLI